IVKLFDDFYLLSSVVLSLSLWHTKTPHFLNSIPYCLTNGVQFMMQTAGFCCVEKTKRKKLLIFQSEAFW
ncbi:hypothetical protein, partial [Faecalibacterium duncaniae]|uniref:hypothetical protein n=1 Tax=Faecalibacterium duncaniae (strain DSM 17677 / JCM 31915 / A2-165) TaxID=411483 RepID=UPI003ED96684